MMQLLLKTCLFDNHALLIILSFLDNIKVKNGMTSFDSFDRLFWKINLTLEHLAHLDVGLPKIGGATALRRWLAYPLHQ